MHNFPAYMDQNIGLMREGIKDHILLPKVIGEKDPHPTQRHGLAGPNPARLLQAVSQNAVGVLGSGQAAPDRGCAANHQDRRYCPPISASAISCRRSTCRHRLSKSARGRSPMAMPRTPTCARSRTTTNFTPEQIHEIGLQEVKRIGAEMDKVREQSGFKGRPGVLSLPAHRPAVLRQDPAELLEYTRARAKTIDPLLMKLFRTFPRLPYGVEPCPRRLRRECPWRTRRDAPMAPARAISTSTPTNLKPGRNTTLRRSSCTRPSPATRFRAAFDRTQRPPQVPALR